MSLERSNLVTDVYTDLRGPPDPRTDGAGVGPLRVAHTTVSSRPVAQEQDVEVIAALHCVPTAISRRVGRATSDECSPPSLDFLDECTLSSREAKTRGAEEGVDVISTRRRVSAVLRGTRERIRLTGESLDQRGRGWIR